MGFAGLHPDRVLGATETEPISVQTDKDAGVFTHQLPTVLGGLLLGALPPQAPRPGRCTPGACAHRQAEGQVLRCVWELSPGAAGDLGWWAASSQCQLRGLIGGPGKAQ